MSSMTMSTMSTMSPIRSISPVQVITDLPTRLGGAASVRPGTVPAPGALRLTRRGRVVLLSAFLVGLAVLMVALAGLAAGTLDRGAPEQVRVVEVGPGDTLYGLAGSVAQPGHIRDMVAQIEQLNSLSGPELQVGQKIALPAR